DAGGPDHQRRGLGAGAGRSRPRQPRRDGGHHRRPQRLAGYVDHGHRVSRMVRRRGVALAAVAGLAVAAALYSWSRSDVRSAGAAAPPPRASEVLPRIDLKRLSSRPSAPPLGQRDVFDFGPPPTVATPHPTLPPSPVAAAP